MSPARRTSARRRMKRYKTKRTWKAIPERLKRLLFEPPEHMLKEWEDKEPTFVYCEEPTLAELEFKGVPTEEWPYYVGYMKRMLALYQNFMGATLQLEKDSLIAEYVLRGYDKEVLEQVQEVAKNCSEEIYLSCPMVKACLEPEWSTWNEASYSPVADALIDNDFLVYIDDEQEIAYITDVSGDSLRTMDLSNGNLAALLANAILSLAHADVGPTNKYLSVLHRYLVAFDTSTNPVTFKVFSRGAEVFSWQLPMATGSYSVSISPSGKWIIIIDDANDRYYVLEGVEA